MARPRPASEIAGLRAAVVSGAMLSEMPFLDHLEELRRRIFKCLIAMAIGLAVCVAYAAELIHFLKRPADMVGLRLGAIEATEMFSLYFRVSLAGAICLSAPSSGTHWCRRGC